MRILAVDDDPSVRALLRLALAPIGDVLIAPLPAGALDLWREHADAIGLVVTDMQMPGMTGHELAVRLGAAQSQTPMLFISGQPAPEQVPAELKNPWDFLAKPFGIAELRQRAQRLIAQAAPAG